METNRQPRALAYSLLVYAQNIDDLTPLAAYVEDVCHKHASLVIVAEQYELVGNYLLGTMGDLLGDTFTPELERAWVKAYWQLADLMISREWQLYAQDPLWAGWRDFRIVGKHAESTEITSFYLEPVDGRPIPLFEPGQYTSIRIVADPLTGLKQPRQYSLSSPPKRTMYRISVRRAVPAAGAEVVQVPNLSLMSNVLHDQYNVGDIVELTHPRGEFALTPTTMASPDGSTSTPLVLLGAGVGITPLLSMFVEQAATAPQRPVMLVHSASTTAQRAFADEVRALATADDPSGCRQYALFVTHPEDWCMQGRDYDFVGRINLNQLNSETELHVPDPRTMYYVCGPPGFMDAVMAELKGQFGIPEDRIKHETFTEVK